MVMETSSTSDSSRKIRRLINFEEREQIAFLMLQEITQHPGITTEQLATEFSISVDESRSILLRHLKAKGKIQNLGWVAINDSSPDESPHPKHDSSPDESPPLNNDSSPDELTIRWKSPGGTARTDSKYPWLCKGDREFIYIGGGNKSNPIAKARVAQIEKWIEEKIPGPEILRRVQEMKRGQMPLE